MTRRPEGQIHRIGLEVLAHEVAVRFDAFGQAAGGGGRSTEVTGTGISSSCGVLPNPRCATGGKTRLTVSTPRWTPSVLADELTQIPLLPFQSTSNRC